MTTYAIATGEIAAHAKTLVASTVDTVTIAATSSSGAVEVLSLDGTAAIYFTVDGTTPTVGGANTYVLPAAIGGLEVEVPTSGTVTVKLISAGTPTYSVTGSSR